AGTGLGTTHSSPKKPSVNSRLPPVAVQQQKPASPSKHPTATAARGKYQAAGSAVSGAVCSTTNEAANPDAPRRPNRARSNAIPSTKPRPPATAAGATAGERLLSRMPHQTTHATATYPDQAAHSRRTTRKTAKARNSWNTGANKAEVNMLMASEVGI